jgi:hypothetical protein
MAASLVRSLLPPDSGDGVAAFDVACVETTGEAVIATRATPGATEVPTATVRNSVV